MREPKHSTNSIMHMSALRLRPVDTHLMEEYHANSNVLRSVF